MSVSDDSDSILPNLQKTRELWNQKSGENSADFLLPKSPISPLKATNSPPPVMENHVNGTQEEGEEVVVRFEDKADDDFDMPDVKSIKTQWEKPGPVPKPIKVAPSTTTRKQEENHSTPQLVPVNRDQEENKEEYDVQLGQLREKFEKESKATSSARVVWNDSPRRTVSKDAVDDKKNMDKKHASHQKARPSSTKTSSNKSSTTTDIVRYEDMPAEEPSYEVEISSLRMRFEQPSVSQKAPTPRGRTPVQKKVSDTNIQQQRAPQESENVKEIFRSSDAKYEQMIGEESVKVRLARYMAMTEAAKPQATERNSYKRRSTTDLVIKKKVEEEAPATGEQEIVRSPPAGTKEKPDYTASIDLEQARQLFEQKSPSPTRGRSSRSSSKSPFRRSPRSRSTPSPINRSSRSISLASSKSPSPSRQSSGRRSPSNKSIKKFGDPDVVVLEHTEVNYYYDSDGTRLSTRTQGLDNLDRSTDNMSEPEVIRPAPAGTKEEADFVPTVNLHSVRDMFENAKAEDQSRARAPPQKRTVVIEKQKEEESAGNSPERNPDIIRSTAAGTREEPQFELSIDLKAARSKFESPLRPESYVPRNKIKEREVEVRRLRVAAAAASPRSSESSDSGYEVVKTAEAGSKEKPDYQVDLKAAKQLFEGGRAPAPVYVKRESSTTTARQHTQIAGEVIRPEPAGTKEVIEIHTSKDVRSVKEKFESSTKEEAEEETNRKPPIDIHEEAREVLRKEKEVMEEVQQPDDESEPKLESGVESESDHTDTEGEMILEHDSDHEPQEAISDVAEERTPSVSSEELVEAEELVENLETEQEEEEMVEASEEQKNADDEDEQSPAAAVVPVRVAIPEDFNEKKEEPEVQQQYETYEKVIDYNEEAHHPTAPSFSIFSLFYLLSDSLHINMDRNETFVSSCVISLRSNNCLKKSKTATSITFVSLADNANNSRDDDVKTHQQVPDIEKLPTSSPEVINSDFVNVADKTCYSDEKASAIVHERSTAQQTNAKIYGDVCAQWRCDESSAAVALPISRCGTMKSQVEETAEMTKHSGMKDNLNEKNSLRQHEDAGQVACFDSMEVYQTVSTSMSQQEKLSELSVVKDRPLPAFNIETLSKDYSQQMREGFSAVEHAESSFKFRHREQNLSTGGNQMCKLTDSRESQYELSDAKQKRNEWEIPPEAIALNETLSMQKIATHGTSGTLQEQQKDKILDSSRIKNCDAFTTNFENIPTMKPLWKSLSQSGAHPISSSNLLKSKPNENLQSNSDCIVSQQGNHFVQSQNYPNPPVISISKGHVKLKSKAFESTKSSFTESSNYSDLSADLNGIIHESVEALQFRPHEERHESQMVGKDALDVDGHVKVKQTLFETLPVDVLYEHGQTHSSQIVTRGRRISNLGEILNEFNTKPLGEINEKELIPPKKDVVEFDVLETVTTFKAMQKNKAVVNKEELHESQRVDYDVPFNNKLVKENSERFLHEDFCNRNEYHSSQTLTEEEKSAACGLLTSMRREFESKRLDFIGVDERPVKHPSQQLVEGEHMRKATEQEEFILSELHSSQQINCHKELLHGGEPVSEKRRQYYDRCNSPARCKSRELIEDSEILNSPDLSGIVRQTAAVYLEECKCGEQRYRQRREKILGGDLYVGPLTNKFETQSIAQLGKSDELHPSQQPIHTPKCLSEEALLTSECPENLSLHMSQVIDPLEYAMISSDVGTMRKAFTAKTEQRHAHAHQLITPDCDVKSIKGAFESCQTLPPSALHPSQIVGHDIHLISSSEAEESLSRIENMQLHESQKVNYGVVRPSIHNLDQPSCIESISGSQDSVPPSNSRSPSRPRSRSSRIKSLKADDEDLELLLNYTPVVKQELPTMVTVMVKGVPDELIKSGHPMITEYVTDSRMGKLFLVGSGDKTETTRPGCRNERVSTSSRKRDLDNVKPFGVGPNDFVQPLLPASPDVLPSYPDSVFPESGCDSSEHPLPPPPLFGNDDADINENTEELCHNFTEMIPHGFVVGSSPSVCHPSRCNDIVSSKQVGLAFSHIDQKHAAIERFANRHMNSSTESCRSFVCVRDDEFKSRTSAATVESYSDSDDQWDFVS